MRIKIDIDMTVRCASILYGVNITVDHQLCSEVYAAHRNRVTGCRHDAAGCRIARCSAAFRTIAVSSDLKRSEQFSR